MKIIVCYASAGVGHRRIAEAVFKEISEKNKDTKIIDALDYTNYFFRYIYTKGYFLLSIWLPKLWEFFFYLCENKVLSFPVGLIRFYVNRLNSKRFNSFLIKEKPEIIISTHFFVNEVVSYLKKKRKIRSYLLSVITDFCTHRFWIQENIDLYIVGIQETKEELINKGVLEDRIKVLGMPVDRKFYISEDRNQICQRLGIREDIFTVLIVTGSFGFGPIEEIVDFLQNDIQTIVICGKNKRLYRRLEQRGYKLTRVYGLVENMDELMTVSDLIITKPGGSTISEALVKKIPMIFISIIPGQEEKNAKIMKRLGVGEISEDIKDLKRIVFCLKEDKDQFNGIKERIKEISKILSAAKAIFNEICKSSYTHSC